MKITESKELIAIASAISKSLNNSTADLNEKFKVLEVSMKEAIEKENAYFYSLSKFGWYLAGDMGFDDVMKVLDALKTSDLVEIERIVIPFYQSNLNRIKRNLVKRYAGRRELLEEAFKSHKKKMFYSSTILFLSQVDGICEGNLFRGKKIFLKFLKEDQSLSMVKSVLGKQSSIDADSRSKQINNSPSNLNRHEVMHGLSTDFGNEINSLKALSLLTFVSDFVNRYKFRSYG